jgi:hypothetical protein
MHPPIGGDSQKAGEHPKYGGSYFKYATVPTGAVSHNTEIAVSRELFFFVSRKTL